MSERIRIRKKRTQGITLLDAVNDPKLFKPWFRNTATWQAWFAWLAALFALPMSAEQLATYRKCTGRTKPPTEPAKEGWLVVGRRGGKSRIMALIAVWLACFKDYSEYLAPGERGTVMVIAQDRRAARVVLGYIRAFLKLPMLKRLVQRQTAESFDLSNGITIEVGTASFRSTRGYTIVAALLDEIAFWPTDDSAEPDYEVLAAIRPGMLTIPNALLLAASSPHARKGVLWKQYRKHFGKDGDPILVWQAPTRTMNPVVPQSFIDEALENDPALNRAEYMAEFRNDLEAFIQREVLDECIDRRIYERPPQPGKRYFSFTDPSGGSNDSMTCAIAHREGRDLVVIDAIREVKAPFDPESVVEEFAKLFKSYRVKETTGDRYAAQWCATAFQRQKIKYIPSDLPKSALYVDLLPVLNSKQIRLLDHDRLTNQLVSLERRVARGGKDSIDHPRGSHDDVANAVAGVSSLIVLKKSTYDIRGFHSDEEMKDDRAPYLERMAAFHQGRMWV